MFCANYSTGIPQSAHYLAVLLYAAVTMKVKELGNLFNDYYYQECLDAIQQYCHCWSYILSSKFCHVFVGSDGI
jgi:hypothetical protein